MVLILSKIIFYKMVGEKGFEPLQPCGYTALNRARLPVPPLAPNNL